MRSDMHKVIVERPRVWGSNRERKWSHLSLEDLPSRESIRSPYLDRKCFGENLAPLRRWLRSQVGRPWNNVYSEACAVIKPDSTIKNHIKVHLMDMVQRNTFMRDGEVWCFGYKFWRQFVEMPVAELHRRWDGFYVHPESGILCEIPSASEVSRHKIEEVKRKEYCQWLGKDRALLKIDRLWFDCVMCSGKYIFGLSAYDAALRRIITERDAQDRYGVSAYCVKKRQLSKSELKRFNLVNSNAA